MKALIGALVLAGLFTTQANAASCGQMIEAKSEAKATIAYLNSKIKDARNADVIAELVDQRSALVQKIQILDSKINDLCKGDDYND
ncbi:hypothetical protein ACLSU7_14055 [Bdellovibrio sp. HCB185ZH]|uniref:hypothetical protein n=1 Tax=Bdellovibrio sp. HCB185ZH TaxID=3394235 RepID=UPI0039A4A417